MLGAEQVEDEVGNLYQLDPDEFVSARNRLAETVRAQGDELGAARVRRLEKPSIGAYWVNQLAYRWPEDVASLLSLGPELREATAERNRERLLILDRQRRIRTDALLSLLWTFGEDEAEAGRRRPSSESLTRAMETLTAAVLDESVGAQVRAGQLTRTAVHEGLGLELLEEDDADVNGVTRVTHLPVVPIRPGADGSRAGSSREFQLQRTAAELVDAEQRLAAATDTVESLTTMLEALEQEIIALTGDRDAARERLEVWQRSVTSAEKAVKSAKRRLDALTGQS